MLCSSVRANVVTLSNTRISTYEKQVCVCGLVFPILTKTRSTLTETNITCGDQRPVPVMHCNLMNFTERRQYKVKASLSCG